MSAIKQPLQDLTSDLAYAAQISDGVIRQVKSIKQKIINAKSEGFDDVTNPPSLDEFFFLSRELFDLDVSYFPYAIPYFQYNITKFQDLHAYPFGDLTPTTLGPYYRNWPVNQTNVVYHCIAIVFNNVSVAGGNFGVTPSSGDRVILAGQINITENGVYLYGGSGYVRETQTNVERGTFLIDDGRAYWNYGTADAPRFVKLTEFDEPQGLTIQDEILSARSHKMFGNTYYNLTKDLTDEITLLMGYLTDFTNDVETLRACTSMNDAELAIPSIETDKTNIDSSIQTISDILFNVERLAAYFEQWISQVSSDFWSATDYSNQIAGGYLNKPHKPIRVLIAFNELEKMYNNNYTKTLGDGSGGASPGGSSMTTGAPPDSTDIAKAIHNHTAIVEYWAQIGWAAAERSSNYRQYISLLEEELRGKEMAGIVEMHDKAAKNVYENNKNLPSGTTDRPAELDPSPLPMPKDQRPMRDESLAWTDEELEELEP
jgi:hypothetical protein